MVWHDCSGFGVEEVGIFGANLLRGTIESFGRPKRAAAKKYSVSTCGTSRWIEARNEVEIESTDGRARSRRADRPSMTFCCIRNRTPSLKRYVGDSVPSI